MNTKADLIEAASRSKLVAIMAIGPSGECGLRGHLPWDLNDDLEFFKQATMGCSVIVGRKTFEVCMRGNTLEGRDLIVMSKRGGELAGAYVADSPLEAQTLAIAHNEGDRPIFVAGGPTVWHSLLSVCDAIIVTHVWSPPDIEHDVRVPIDWSEWVRVMRLEVKYHAKSRAVNDLWTMTALYERV